jgi:hypothetical protein
MSLRSAPGDARACPGGNGDRRSVLAVERACLGVDEAIPRVFPAAMATSRVRPGTSGRREPRAGA